MIFKNYKKENKKLKDEIQNIKYELDLVIEDKINVICSLKNDYKKCLEKCNLLENDILMINYKNKLLKQENEELRLGQKSLKNKIKYEVDENDNKNISELSIKKSKSTKVKTNKKV